MWRLHVQQYVPEAWEGAIDESRKQWNNTSQVQYLITFEETNWYNFNLDNVDFSYWGYPAVPALTYFPGQYNIPPWTWDPTHNRADVKLNNNFTWNVVGTMNQVQMKADVRTITIHEIGHATGLAHPTDCGNPFTVAESNSAMHPNWTKKWTTNSDDDNGNIDIYGAP